MRWTPNLIPHLDFTFLGPFVIHLLRAEPTVDDKVRVDIAVIKTLQETADTIFHHA